MKLLIIKMYLGCSVNNLRVDTHMTSMKIVQFSRLPHHACPSMSKIHLECPVSNISPPSPNDKQSIKRKPNPRMTNICY